MKFSIVLLNIIISLHLILQSICQAKTPSLFDVIDSKIIFFIYRTSTASGGLQIFSNN
jgi:hypothetical protein